MREQQNEETEPEHLHGGVQRDGRMTESLAQVEYVAETNELQEQENPTDGGAGGERGREILEEKVSP